MRPEGAHVGQLALRTVDRVLDEALPTPGRVHLLDAARGDLQQLRQHLFRLLRTTAEREPDHALKACLRRLKRPSLPFGAG